MNLFRIDKKKTFQGPHQSLHLHQCGANLKEAKSAMIMIHGRGASPESILSLTNEIKHRKEITFYAPEAHGFTWYPYSFLAPLEKNQPKLNSAFQSIYDAITVAENAGFSKDKIFILGFSQGACLAAEYVARHPDKYAGIFIFSGGLVGYRINEDSYTGNLHKTPIFIGCSDVDTHIPLQRIHKTNSILSSINGDVTKVIYPNFGHTINKDEIDHLNKIISDRI